MNYGPRDRAPFHEFFWPTWPETVERWSRDGVYDPAGTDFENYCYFMERLLANL